MRMQGTMDAGLNGLKSGSTHTRLLGGWVIGRGFNGPPLHVWALQHHITEKQAHEVEIPKNLNENNSFPVRHYRASSYRDASSEWRQCVTRRKGSQSIPSQKHHRANHRADPTLLFSHRSAPCIASFSLGPSSRRAMHAPCDAARLAVRCYC